MYPVRLRGSQSPRFQAFISYCTLLKRKALPVAPVNRVEISSDLLVRMVSQLAQEKRRVPPMWSRKIRPIVKSLGVTELRQKYEILN